MRVQGVCAGLEEGIQAERLCTQLVEQHGAAQDWLRDQVKGLGPLPADRPGLQCAINTLKVGHPSSDYRVSKHGH